MAKTVSISAILRDLELPKTIVLPITYQHMMDELEIPYEIHGNKLVVELRTKNFAKGLMSKLKKKNNRQATNIILLIAGEQ
ncbi:MAG: hypothetical protein D6698_06390 [Gammaproteobacteria bacterium]|nr:MAG: hypothetical protein D6698_06390 [Gammaproteobacteria bacterium]